MGKDQQAGGAMDVDAWKAFGGSLEGKVYVAPTGEAPAPGGRASERPVAPRLAPSKKRSGFGALRR